MSNLWGERPLYLGHQGENLARTKTANVAGWLETWPDAQIVLAVAQPGAVEVYLPDITISGGILSWPIRAYDTAVAGGGRAEIRAYEGDVLVKSDIIQTVVDAALPTSAGPIPAPVPDWVSDVIEAAESAENSAEAAQRAAAAVKNLSAQVMPVYIGDFFAGDAYPDFPGYYPGCCVKIGDYIYTFSSGGATTNEGLIRRFDLVNNTEDKAWAKTALTGHANSCAYDSTTGTVYVVPLMDYSVTPSVVAQYVYAYNASDFSYIGTVSTPTSIQAISFDPVAQKLYYYGYHGRIYVRDTSSPDGWTVICWVKTDNLSLAPRPNSHTFDQDFAVYNGRFYLSSAHGNVCTGLVYSTNPVIPETGWTIAKLDSTARFYLGEPEGWEFTDDGHLIGLNFVQILSGLWDNYVLEYPVGIVPPYAPMIGDADSYHDGTLSLNADTQAKFGLWTYEIRSLAQMEVRFLKDNSNTVLIPSGDPVVDPYYIRVNSAIKLQINGTYSCKQLNVFHGYLNIYGGADHCTLELTLDDTDQDPINLRHSSRLGFTGGNALYVSVPNKTNFNGANFVSIGWDYPLLGVRIAPVSVEGYTLKIGGVHIASDIFYMGTHPMYLVSNRYLSRTYDNNAYMTQADFKANINCQVLGYHYGILNFNFPVKVQLPTDGTWVTIGHFDGAYPDQDVHEILPSERGGAPLHVWYSRYGYVNLRTYGQMVIDANDPDVYHKRILYNAMNWEGLV